MSCTYVDVCRGYSLMDVACLDDDLIGRARNSTNNAFTYIIPAAADVAADDDL